MNIQLRNWEHLTEEEREAVYHRSERDTESVLPVVDSIVKRVRDYGDTALVDLTREFDGAELSEDRLKVTEEEFEAAEGILDGSIKQALQHAIGNVRRFHEHQKPDDLNFIEVTPGVFAGERALPLPSAGLYVPRGRGSFPSMLYMLAVPAMIAEVPRICVVSPPGRDGTIDPACLYAARLCGVHEVYRIGGAQAIAALAYGTEHIPAVTKIVGPGSIYVAAAKQLVGSIVDTGLPAGPSESMILADNTANPEDVAHDLMIEAEHGSDSSAFLITPDQKLAEEVASRVEDLLQDIPDFRRRFINDVLSGYGGILVTQDMETAVSIVNRYAPEHLQIHTAEPFGLLHSIRNAGEVLLGSNTPFSSANYAAGANAVLPTGGKATSFSPVSVRDFIRYMSVVYNTSEGLEGIASTVQTLADYEGFPAHAAAIRHRNPNKKG
ncbi:MAG: histidinol dehydrogenase [Spirochaetales bacterium]|nr:histidinol dehydrogenase [Spirochaetales bacterium]MCF7937876.1 histidinol dehydrogenase [Spirochaetales bacterium]